MAYKNPNTGWNLGGTGGPPRQKAASSPGTAPTTGTQSPGTPPPSSYYDPLAGSGYSSSPANTPSYYSGNQSTGQAIYNTPSTSAPSSSSSSSSPYSYGNGPPMTGGSYGNGTGKGGYSYGYNYDPNNLNNQWFNANNPMGAATQNSYYTANPQAGYLEYLNGQGLGGNTNAGQYGQSQESRYYNNYLSYLPYMDPNHNQFLDFLNGSSSTPTNDYWGQGASNRGDQSNNFAPRVRFSAPS